MKKIVFIGLLILFSQKDIAQTIIPLEQYKTIWEANQGLPDNSYVKDLNNIMGRFLGTWRYNANGLAYIFIITKETHTFFNVKADQLVINYTIGNISTGQLFVDTRKLSVTDEKITKGFMYYPEKDGFLFDYVYNEGCGQIGQLFIRQEAPTYIYLNLTLIGDTKPIIIDCGTDLNLTPPHNNRITLEKQTF
ncbi:hypothetical protein [Flavobacterium sp.]|uniref:hypothetical protein n=1 Tax=Flavobacterium sp. TaxID=239 RepID=UPI0038FC09EE